MASGAKLAPGDRTKKLRLRPVKPLACGDGRIYGVWYCPPQTDKFTSQSDWQNGINASEGADRSWHRILRHERCMMKEGFAEASLISSVGVAIA